MLFNDLLLKGFTAENFIVGLAAHLRDVLVGKDEATLPLLELSDDIRERYRKQAAECSNEFLYDAMELATECEQEYKLSKNKRLLVELMLIRMCQLSEQKENQETPA